MMVCTTFVPSPSQKAEKAEEGHVGSKRQISAVVVRHNFPPCMWSIFSDSSMPTAPTKRRDQWRTITIFPSKMKQHKSAWSACRACLWVAWIMFSHAFLLFVCFRGKGPPIRTRLRSTTS